MTKKRTKARKPGSARELFAHGAVTPVSLVVHERTHDSMWRYGLKIGSSVSGPDDGYAVFYGADNIRELVNAARRVISKIERDRERLADRRSRGKK